MSLDVTPSPQTLRSQDLFKAHHIDDFTLHVKSAILLKRVRSYVSRTMMAHRVFTRPPEGYEPLNRAVQDFLSTFPPPGQGVAISADRIVAHANLHLAMINLHEFLVHATDANENSYFHDCMQRGAQGLVAGVRHVTATSFDLCLLHPQTFLAWAVAISALLAEVDACRRAEDAQGEARAAEDIGMILNALGQAGFKSRRAKRMAELAHLACAGQLRASDLK